MAALPTGAGSLRCVCRAWPAPPDSVLPALPDLKLPAIRLLLGCPKLSCLRRMLSNCSSVLDKPLEEYAPCDAGRDERCAATSRCRAGAKGEGGNGQASSPSVVSMQPHRYRVHFHFADWPYTCAAASAQGRGESAPKQSRGYIESSML